MNFLILKPLFKKEKNKNKLNLLTYGTYDNKTKQTNGNENGKL